MNADELSDYEQIQMIITDENSNVNQPESQAIDIAHNLENPNEGPDHPEASRLNFNGNASRIQRNILHPDIKVNVALCLVIIAVIVFILLMDALVKK